MVWFKYFIFCQFKNLVEVENLNNYQKDNSTSPWTENSILKTLFSMSTIYISSVKSTNSSWLISLQVEDHDTPPEELHYLVISKPNNGYLTLGERPEPVTSFTQYDVNHRRLHFIQQVKRRQSGGRNFYTVTFWLMSSWSSIKITIASL